MSRASNIIEWLLLVDEANMPSAFTVGCDDDHDLNNADGYHYQGKYAGDDVEDGKDSRDLDGTKPSGMGVTNAYGKGQRTGRTMSAADKAKMDTAFGKN